MTFLLVKWLKRLAKCSLSKVKLYKDILLFLFPITVWKLGNLNFLFLPVSYFQRLLYHIDTLYKWKLWIIQFISCIEKNLLCQNFAPCDGRILTVWNSKITNFKSFERKTSEKKLDMTTVCCSLVIFFSFNSSYFWSGVPFHR